MALNAEGRFLDFGNYLLMQNLTPTGVHLSGVGSRRKLAASRLCAREAASAGVSE
jgi:hypothetical protein